jgi:hypothetical protein
MKTNLVMSSFVLTLLLSGTAGFAMERDPFHEEVKEALPKNVKKTPKYSKDQINKTSKCLREVYCFKSKLISPFATFADHIPCMSYCGLPSTYGALFEQFEKELDRKILTKLENEWNNIPPFVSTYVKQELQAQTRESKGKWLEFYERAEDYQKQGSDALLKEEAQLQNFAREVETYATSLRNLPFFSTSLKEFLNSVMEKTKTSMTLEQLLPSTVPAPAPVPVPVPVPAPVKEEKKALPLSEEDEDVRAMINAITNECMTIAQFGGSESVMKIGRNVANEHVPSIRDYLPKLITFVESAAITDTRSIRVFLGNNVPDTINLALNNANRTGGNYKVLPYGPNGIPYDPDGRSGIKARDFLVEVVNLVKQIVSQNPEDEDARLLKRILFLQLEDQSGNCYPGLVGRMFTVYFQCFKYLTQFPAEDIKRRVKKQEEALAKLEPKKH